MDREIKKCLIHQDEEISNFCAVNGCFVELCASCIGSHTDKHLREGTKPIYQSIKKAIVLTSQKLADYRDLVTKDKMRIKNLIENIEQNRKQIEAILKIARDDCMRMVEQTFQEIQQTLFQQLKAQKTKTGLHNIKKLQKLYQELNHHSQDITNLTKQLNMTKNISLATQINNSYLGKGYAFRNRVNAQIIDNEQFKTNFVYHTAHLQEIQRVIKNFMTTSFIYPNSKARHQVVTLSTGRSNEKVFYNETGRSTVDKNRVSPIKKVIEQLSPKQRKKVEQNWLRPSRSPLKPNLNYYTSTL